jgi:hypothetical protein
LYEQVKNDLQQKANWTDSDDLDMMFHNTYSQAYYRALQRHVHWFFHWEKSKRALQNIGKRPDKTSLRQVKDALKGIYVGPLSLLGGRKLDQLQKSTRHAVHV